MFMVDPPMLAQSYLDSSEMVPPEFFKKRGRRKTKRIDRQNYGASEAYQVPTMNEAQEAGAVDDVDNETMQIPATLNDVHSRDDGDDHIDNSDDDSDNYSSGSDSDSGNLLPQVVKRKTKCSACGDAAHYVCSCGRPNTQHMWTEHIKPVRAFVLRKREEQVQVMHQFYGEAEDSND
jgi:hypothetical protein